MNGLHEATTEGARKGWSSPGRCQRRRQRAAEALAKEAKLPPGAWGPQELEKVAQVLSLRGYRIVVIDARRTYVLFSYGQGDTMLGLLLDRDHYDGMTSIPRFMGKSYLCHVCLKGYNDPGQHACDANKGTHCSSCHQTDCQELTPELLDRPHRLSRQEELSQVFDLLVGPRPDRSSLVRSCQLPIVQTVCRHGKSPLLHPTTAAPTGG